MTKSSLPLVALAAALAMPASAQLVAAPANDADRLAAEMRVVGANPTDVAALTDAGELSTKLGDLSGAASLFARADKVDPRNGRVKAGMAGVLLHLERPGEALQFYNQAEGYGYPVARFAADRALAYDLIAQQGRAQRDYRTALSSGAGDDETVRRYALSLGISGQKEAALHLLDPLLRRNDRAGWRARAFVLAMNGETGAAQTIATTMMAPGQASGMAAFFARLPALGPADRAFAVQFGELRPTPQRLADLRLAPALPVLAAEIVPVARPVAPVQIAVARVDRHRRGKKDAVQLAAVVPLPVAPPLPAPPAYGARTLASGPALAARAPVPGFGVSAPPSRTLVAVAAVGTRTFPSADGVSSQPGRAPTAVAALAPRVLPARSPLPPPPVLPALEHGAGSREAIVTTGTGVNAVPRQSASTQLTTSTAPPAAIRPAPAALAQAPAARAGTYVAIERPGSLLPTYIRVASGSRASVVTPTPTPSPIAPEVARVTGVITASAPTPATLPPVVMAAPAASATAPGLAGPAPTISPVPTGAIATLPRAATAPVPTLGAAPPHDVGPIVATIDPRPAPPSATARVAAPAASAGAGASPPAPAPTRSILPPPASVGPPAPGASSSSAGLSAPSVTVAPTRAPPPPVVAATAAQTAPPSVADLSAGGATSGGGLVGPSLDPGRAVAPATTSSSSRPALAAEAAPVGVTAAAVPLPSLSPVGPGASGEPAGVAVVRAFPASGGSLAGIIAALPVPASELNIAPIDGIPKQSGADPQPAKTAAGSGASARPDATGGARRDDAGSARQASSARSGRHRPGVIADEVAATRNHGTPEPDAVAPAATAKSRKRDAVAADSAPNDRKQASDRASPTTGKGRHPALARADEDEAPPAHGKHGRHDSDDEDRPAGRRAVGRKTLPEKLDAAPQKYWVQVAGGANGASLGKAWQIAQGKAPALAGRKGYTAPLHATNRVLAGPFKSDDEARAFVNTLNKQGVHAFQFTNSKGQKVKKLDDE